MVMCPKQQQNANWIQVEIEILIVRARNLPRTNSTKYETQIIFAKKQQNEHTPEVWALFGRGYELPPRELRRLWYPGVCSFCWNFTERQILWSLCSVDFHTLTLQLPIQTPHSVAPELQVFMSSLKISAKRAHPWVTSMYAKHEHK